MSPGALKHFGALYFMIQILIGPLLLMPPSCLQKLLPLLPAPTIIKLTNALTFLIVIQIRDVPDIRFHSVSGRIVAIRFHPDTAG